VSRLASRHHSNTPRNLSGRGWTERETWVYS
jgi:hypothetical protein